MCIRDRPDTYQALIAGRDDNDANSEELDLDGRRFDLRGWPCLLYTSDAADERSSVDLGGRRIIKKTTEM